MQIGAITSECLASRKLVDTVRKMVHGFEIHPKCPDLSFVCPASNFVKLATIIDMSNEVKRPTARLRTLVA